MRSISEYTFVENPLLVPLAAFGWTEIDQGLGLAAHAINITDDGRPWLTAKRSTTWTTRG